MSIVSTIQTLLNDSGVFWPTDQILDAVNEAQLFVLAQTKWTKSTVTLNVTINEDLVSLPEGILIPGWIEGTHTNQDNTATVVRFFPTTQRQLEHFMRTWRGARQDQPGYFVIWDASHLRIFPRPDKAYTYTIWSILYPTEVTSVDQDLVGPPNFQLAVQNYTTALLLEATRPDLAEIYMATAEKQITDFRLHLRNYQSHNIRRLRPARRMDLQQSGVIRELPVYYPLEA